MTIDMPPSASPNMSLHTFAAAAPIVSRRLSGHNFSPRSQSCPQISGAHWCTICPAYGHVLSSVISEPAFENVKTSALSGRKVSVEEKILILECKNRNLESELQRSRAEILSQNKQISILREQVAAMHMRKNKVTEKNLSLEREIIDFNNNIDRLRKYAAFRDYENEDLCEENTSLRRDNSLLFSQNTLGLKRQAQAHEAYERAQLANGEKDRIIEKLLLQLGDSEKILSSIDTVNKFLCGEIINLCLKADNLERENRQLCRKMSDTQTNIYFSKIGSSAAKSNGICASSHRFRSHSSENIAVNVNSPASVDSAEIVPDADVEITALDGNECEDSISRLTISGKIHAKSKK
ncbi:MAG: hypothetical protein LBT64_00675 [Puniceicoccales bacterium]|jgi:hypothetical protein|nr:hypothetical protein [Puniceicoccales bacterium]